jgi:hypothetical protein
MAPHAGADLVTEVIVHAEPGPITAPGAEALIGGLPMGQIMWHQAPGTAGAQHRLDTIDHLTQRVFAGSAPRFFWRQHGFQDLPFLVGQVTGVGQALGGHGRFSLIAGVDHVSKPLNAPYTPSYIASS